MLAMALGTITTGILAGSALLLAVGAGSAIDMFSACALYRRLQLEIHGDDPKHIHNLERRTAKLVGVLLLLTAAYVLGMAIYKFEEHSAPSDSYVGIGISLIAAVWMPFLARSKTHLAKEIGSPALHADGVGTLVCGLMSWAVLVGLVANALLRWWWIDSVGAVLLTPLLVKEARDAWLSGTRTAQTLKNVGV